MGKEVFGYDGDKFRTEDFAVENCGSVGYTVGGGWVRGFSGDWYPSSSPLISPSRAGGRASPRHPRSHPCSFRSTPPLCGKDRSNHPVYTATRWFAKLISLPLSLSHSVFLSFSFFFCIQSSASSYGPGGCASSSLRWMASTCKNHE